MKNNVVRMHLKIILNAEVRHLADLLIKNLRSWDHVTLVVDAFDATPIISE
jgi:hypothetical protein